MEPDLEGIAALQPDLIISVNARDEELYDRRSAIAPAVFPEQSGDWGDAFLVYANALNANDRVAGVVTGSDERCTEIAASLDDKFETTTISLIRSYAANPEPDGIAR